MRLLYKGELTMKKCFGCGSGKRVVLCLNKERGKYVIKPLCIKCIKNRFALSEILDWENRLSELEKEIAKQIINEYFPNVRNRKEFENMITELMSKYSVRNVFETCVKYQPLFDTNDIENRCKLSVR